MLSPRSVTQFWSDWGLRICVLGSLAAYVFLGLLSRTRRRSAYGNLSIRFQGVLRAIVWFLYQFAEIAALYALGSMSLCDADASPTTEEEQQLVAFWAPFLLVHLAGPDNMIAYALEDNMPSPRKKLEMGIQVIGILVTMWNYLYRAHSVLSVAAWAIFSQGIIRYGERTLYAKAQMESMQERAGSPRSIELLESTVSRSLQLQQGRQRPLDDGEALLLAQDLFPVWRRFLVDFSVGLEASASEKVLSLDWRSMCKVVEMELSLMYEVLYTKALVAHTWPGYLIRFESPFLTTTAVWYFWHHRANKQESHPISGRAASSFVKITYLLLATAFILDMVWLLSALGSTWTYAFLKTKLATPPPWPRVFWSWIHHKALCAGWWHRLHSLVIYLDPLRILRIIDDPVAYRKWSGTIGRYNLLRECSAPRRRPWLLLRWRGRKHRYLSKLPEDVKKVLFERVQEILAPHRCSDADGAYTMEDITKCWGQVTLRRSPELFEDKVELPPTFGREFDEDVIAWHIATCIFLSRDRVRKEANSSSTHAAAIEVMSEYLMFLLAERRHMIPGLLHTLLDRTRTALKTIWKDDRKGNETLATLLRRRRNSRRNDGEGQTAWAENDGERLVADATAIAGALTKGSQNQRKVVQMLDFIFNVWVEKLLYAAIRCSRESHAKQLGEGGELTTVLWMLVQHAGPFRIGRDMPKEEKERQIKKSREKQKPAPDARPPTGPWPWPHRGLGGQAGTSMEHMPSTEGEEHEDERLMPEDEQDPDDARDYNTPVEYITMY